MPGLNKTGPMGQGPMTGRKMGQCAGFGAKSKNSAGEKSEDATDILTENFRGRGMGLGRGRGQGKRGMGRQNRFGSGHTNI